MLGDFWHPARRKTPEFLIRKKQLRDFLYRNNLPGGEDRVLEETPEFWKLIESAKSTNC